ncbi:MAG TPA: chemotaxis protein CheX [Bacillota bacterium]|nr:chemotaxis protein CheX [Bacillota bacterium]
MTTERNRVITKLLNGTLSSLNTVVPMNFQADKPQLVKQDFCLNFGVLIGITGDLMGKLVLSGKPNVFGLIGNAMFNMPLEGEMLQSFSGELGNMVAGGLSTHISNNGININITAPTILQGDVTLSGFQQGLEVAVVFNQENKMNTFLLLD